jgi:hypothetical protein
MNNYIPGILRPFSTRLSFVGIAYHVSKSVADKGKRRFPRTHSSSGK